MVKAVRSVRGRPGGSFSITHAQASYGESRMSHSWVSLQIRKAGRRTPRRGFVYEFKSMIQKLVFGATDSFQLTFLRHELCIHSHFPLATSEQLVQVWRIEKISKCKLSKNHNLQWWDKWLTACLGRLETLILQNKIRFWELCVVLYILYFHFLILILEPHKLSGFADDFGAQSQVIKLTDRRSLVERKRTIYVVFPQHSWRWGRWNALSHLSGEDRISSVRQADPEQVSPFIQQLLRTSLRCL